MRFFAIPDRASCPGSRTAVLALAVLFLISLAASASGAGALPVHVSAQRIVTADVHLEQVNATWVDGAATVSIGQIRPSDERGVSARDFSLQCPVGADPGGNVCPGGAWSLTVADAGWSLPLRGEVEHLARVERAWSLGGSMRQDTRLLRVDATAGSDRVSARISWQEQALANLPAIALVPESLQWITAGASSGELRWEAPPSSASTMTYDLDVAGLGFDSPDGRFAGENLLARCSGTISAGAKTPGATTASAGMDAGLNLQITGGELLLDDLYVSFAANSLQVHAEARISDSEVRVNRVDITDGDSLVLGARARWDRKNEAAPVGYHLDRLELKFPLAYTRYLESLGAAATLDGLAVTGSLAWNSAGPGGLDGAGTLDIADLTIVDTRRGRFAVTGLDAHVLAGERQATETPPAEIAAMAYDLDKRAVESRFSWRGLLLRRINLGAGSAALDASPGQFALAEPLRLQVLGGQLALDELEVKLGGGESGGAAEPEIRMFASIQDLDVERLTEALGWPRFGGTISGRIPGVTLRGGVLAVEGEIAFNVFSGQVLLSGLRVERPFGVLPSLAANLEVQDIDLKQLTRTFSFGHISGQMSGYVHDLRMLDWKPVAFDAWFGTPTREQGSHEISRQAVNHLTTLGGGSATAALTGPVMKLFNNFSYKRLGLGCRLSNNTCEVRGLDDDEVSVLIMEGAGVPKIMIRAFNRRMDFATLAAGLAAASRGESVRIGDRP